MTTSGLVPQDQQQLHGGKVCWSNKKLYMKFTIKLYVICWNRLYIGHYLLCKGSFYVFALLSSIGKLLWGVFNRCLPQSVNYEIITTKSP